LAPAARLEHSAAADGRAWHNVLRTSGDLRARVAALPTALAGVAAELAPLLSTLASPAFVWYATLGLGFVSGRVTDAAASAGAVTSARAMLARRHATLTLAAAPPEVRATVDMWPSPPPGALALMQRLKQRFDPEGRLAAGRFVGGL
jgi:glycolate oxidase FAD binding subunit